MPSMVALTIGIACGIVAAIGLLYVSRAAKSGKKPPQAYQTSFIYSGNLKQTSIVDAIQLLEIGKREGILHIYHGRRKGYIAFVNGMVIDAFYRNAVGREAVFAMMALPEGDFYFESKKITQPRLITDSVMDLVMTYESYRFQQFTSGNE